MDMRLKERDSSMADRILLTGGTGFLGTELAARLTGRPDTQVYVLVRAVNEEEAIHRLKGAWYHDKALYASIGKTCIPVTGDFTQIGLGLSEEDRNRLLEQVTTVIHAGAEIGFQKSREELLRTNCEGTRNVLTLAGEMKKLRRFVHISTAYVAGTAKGVVREESPAGTAFSSYYEESKAEAEKLVRTSGLPYTICRPGMIVGDSRTGWVRNFNTIYYVLKMMLLGKMRVLPIRQDAPLNIVPGDYVADCVAKISFDEEAAGRTFHLTCPEEMAPRAGELAEYVREWASRNLHIHLAKPVYMPLPALKQAGLVHNKKESGRKKDYLRNMLTLLPYFYGEQSFDRTNTDRICGAYEPAWQEYIGRLLAFACRKNFIRADRGAPDHDQSHGRQCDPDNRYGAPRDDDHGRRGRRADAQSESEEGQCGSALCLGNRGDVSLREYAFIKLLTILENRSPEWVTRVQMQILLDTTARGFGVRSRRIAHLPAEEALAAYAQFTMECMESLPASVKCPPEQRQAQRAGRRAVLRCLYREAYRTGSRIRRITGVTESRDIERLVFYLYSNLRIAMSGHIPGEITVTDCYFGRMYTPAQCAVMSLVDSGVIAGICGGGKLEFSGRITEGCGKCTACFSKER